jgi:serine/threonine-protein kinase
VKQPHDPNQTADISSTPADRLDAGLAAGFGRPADGSSSVLEDLQSSLGPLGPALLREPHGESAAIVQPKSDAIPTPEQAGPRYQLSGEIARGGMGAVLRGRDVDLGRDLAVKVLLEKYADRPEVARRFLEEAQVGAQLQHPGVVPVYDIGRFGDRPFFTMKLVKGKTLAALLSERETPALDAPGSPKDLPRFLDIALKVAQTLAYAHAKGVIHRDLKPANVMVGAFGEVQVMDWGLAKVLAEGGSADEEKVSRERERPEDVTTIRTARSGASPGSFGTATEAGSLLGTPAYMPPEQANGEVAQMDRRADVFGLGAILCEILTGKPPYVGRSAEEVRRKAANGDQGEAHTRLDACEADAELIALTNNCLSPEAIDRPKDARAVADALTGYLDGVQARLHKAELAKAAAKARAVEEAKRRRLALALAATVLLAVTLGGGGWLWVKADQDARQAQLTLDVHEALNRATRLREQAKTANVGGAALLAQAREHAQRAVALVENSPADPELAAQVRQLQTELDEEEKNRKLVNDLDEARLAQAETLTDSGRFAQEQAVPLFRKAFQDYGLAVGAGEPKTVAAEIRRQPDPVREALIGALDEWIGMAENPTLQINEPDLGWLRAVARATEPKDGWTQRFRAAREEKDVTKQRKMLLSLAKEANLQRLPARSLVRLAKRLTDVQAGSEAVQVLRRTLRQHPADFWAHHDLAIALVNAQPPEAAEGVRFFTAAVALRPGSAGAHMNLGIALAVKGLPDEAIVCFHKAIELNPRHGMAYVNLGNALKEKKRFDEAIACFRKGMKLDRTLVLAHFNLGSALKESGRLPEAMACYRKFVKLEENPVNLIHMGALLAQLQKDYDLAIACFQKAIKLDPRKAIAHYDLGVALQNKGRLEAAIASLRKAIELDPRHVASHTQLADALHRTGQVDAALASFRKAALLDPNSAVTHENLGVALEKSAQWDAAIACHRQAIALNPKLATAHRNLGNALLGKGQTDAAIDWYRKAIDLDPKLAPSYYNLGNALLTKGQLDAAIAVFRHALELDPKFAPAHTGLGNALRDQGQPDAAIACYRRALEFNPKLVHAHNELGVVLSNVKRDYDGAIACFRRVLQIDPKFALGQLNLGITLKKLGRTGEAIPCFRRAIELNPKDANAHYNLGLALRSQGQLDEAIAAYGEAIRLRPAFAEAHNYLGNALNDQGKHVEASAAFRETIRLKPDHARAYGNLGNALRAQRKFDQAIAQYREAIRLQPDLIYAHLNLGRTLAAKGQLDAAIACYRKVIELDPKYGWVYFDLGNALKAKGRYEEAITCYRKNIELQPRNAGTFNNLGNALIARGKVDEAIACYRKAIELEPTFVRGHTNLGDALRSRGQLDAAIACFQKAVQLEPKNPRRHINLGTALYDKDQLDAALACYRKAIELAPKEAGTHFLLGMVLVDKGLLDDGIASYRQAIALDPKYPNAHGALGQALFAKGRYAEARDTCARALELCADDNSLRTLVSEQFEASKRYLRLENRFPRLLSGKDKVGSAQDGLALLTICARKRMHAAAARFAAGAFAADPNVAGDLQAGHRYNAVCSAALAAAGQGNDAARLDNEERKRLRQQALDWLHADLTLRIKHLQSKLPAHQAAARTVLRHWQKDSDLASLRDPAALAKLPAEEQKAFAQLWTEVAALLKNAGNRPR